MVGWQRRGKQTTPNFTKGILAGLSPSKGFSLIDKGKQGPSSGSQVGDETPALVDQIQELPYLKLVLGCLPVSASPQLLRVRIHAQEWLESPGTGCWGYRNTGVKLRS